MTTWASQVAVVVKNLPANARDPGLIPGSGRSPGEGNGNPLHYSCLGNPLDRGAWQVIVHVVAKTQTQLSGFHFPFTIWMELGLVLGVGISGKLIDDLQILFLSPLYFFCFLQ